MTKRALLQLRLTHTEKAKFEAAAEGAGMSVSAWLRRLGNEDADFRRAQSWEKDNALGDELAAEARDSLRLAQIVAEFRAPG